MEGARGGARLRLDALQPPPVSAGCGVARAVVSAQQSTNQCFFDRLHEYTITYQITVFRFHSARVGVEGRGGEPGFLTGQTVQKYKPCNGKNFTISREENDCTFKIVEDNRGIVVGGEYIGAKFETSA